MAKQWEAPAALETINRIYDQIQERTPDDSGQMYWSGFLVQGTQSVKDIIRYISQSDKYVGRFITGKPAEDAVQICYKHFLGVWQTTEVCTTTHKLPRRRACRRLLNCS